MIACGVCRHGAIREDRSSARLHDDRIAVDHIRLDLIPDIVGASALGDGYPAEIHSGGTVLVGDADVVVTYGFQNGPPEGSAIGVEGHVEECAAGIGLLPVSAREIGQERDSSGSRGDLRSIRAQLPVAYIAAVYAVLEPSERKASGTDETPVEVRVVQRPAVEYEPLAVTAKLRDDTVGGDAEHGAGSRDVGCLSGMEHPASQHGLHRVAGTSAHGGSRTEADGLCDLGRQMAYHIPGLHDAGHHALVDAEDRELLV